MGFVWPGQLFEFKILMLLGFSLCQRHSSKSYTYGVCAHAQFLPQIFVTGTLVYGPPCLRLNNITCYQRNPSSLADLAHSIWKLYFYPENGASSTFHGLLIPEFQPCCHTVSHTSTHVTLHPSFLLQLSAPSGESTSCPFSSHLCFHYLSQPESMV